MASTSRASLPALPSMRSTKTHTGLSASTSRASLPGPPAPPSPARPPSPSTPSPPSSPVAASRNDNAFELRVVTLLLDIKAQVEHNTKLIIAERTKNREPDEADAVFPLKTLEEVDALEQTVKDVSKQKRLVQQLLHIGGTNLATTVRRILTYCLTQDVAIAFNWLGKGNGEKRAFSTLALKTAIFKAVQKNPLTSAASLAEVEAVMKSWFKHAADRNAGRQRRGNND
ncbi:uncharacterized protein LOC119733628 [Patiria miniata]|uniref:DUF4806 domain-containing protein n=1 Tax=Patiria miniata TaxID=46514 RepID=A0A914AHF3_PATMI|nr:uncharacterized protein LOC119733628 [Patiria miniata]